MPVDTPETRTLIHLRTGSKICVIVAVCLIAVAVYYYFVPVSVTTSSGGVFQCGSAAHPPTSTFQKNVCEDITHVDLYRTFLFAAAGVLVAALGCWFFGVDRTVEERTPRVYDDEPGDGDEDRPARRGSRRHADDVDDEIEDDLPRRRATSRGRRRDDERDDDRPDDRDEERRERRSRRDDRRRDDDYDDDDDFDDYDERPSRRPRRDADETRPRRRTAVDTED